MGGGGSLGRTEATGYGVIYTVREAMKHLKMDRSKSAAAIQGFGNVAQYAAIGFTELLGGKVVASPVGTATIRLPYTVSKPRASIRASCRASPTNTARSTRKKAKEAGYAIEDGDAWMSKDVDVLIPAALEGQINARDRRDDQRPGQDRRRRRQRPHHPGSG